MSRKPAAEASGSASEALKACEVSDGVVSAMV